MYIQFDIETKYFTVYKRGFFEAISIVIRNWKKLKLIRIWLIR